MTFNWWTFLFEILNFVVLAYILHRLLYKPLREAIDQRRIANAEAMAKAESARREAESLQQSLREQIAAGEKQRESLFLQAREQSELERKRLLAIAEETVRRRHEEANQTFQRDREEALQSVRREVLHESVELTRRLIADSVDRTLHQQLALRFVQVLEDIPESEKISVRSNWHLGDHTVLESAADLDSPCRERLNLAISSLVGASISLKVHHRPELLAGLRLRLAGYVWDGSLAGQIESANLADERRQLA